MLMAAILLALLFTLGLIAAFFSFPSKDLTAFFQSLFVKSSSHAVKTNPNQTVPHKKVKTGMIAYNNTELKGVFATFDKNNDGYITRKELKESLKNIGIIMEEKDIAEMVQRADSNGDGLIDFDEFCELFELILSREEGSYGEEEVGADLKEAFDIFDRDRDGLISVEELALVLSSLGFKEGKKLEDCKEMITKVDADGDGMVNFDEFKIMMKAGGKLNPVS